jgi:hypothetical protein
MPPLTVRAAQITCPLPSGAQLGAEVTVPTKFFQPDQVVPLNWFTKIVFVKLRAAQTASPLVSEAQEGSEFIVFFPRETNDPQEAIAGNVCMRKHKRGKQKISRNFICRFSFGTACFG